jgi:hypothetical protein
MKASTLLVCASLLLGACSNGVDVPATVSGTEVPVTATTDSAAALLFVKQIVLAGDKNDEEPIQVGSVSLAQGESQEPDESI